MPCRCTLRQRLKRPRTSAKLNYLLLRLHSMADFSTWDRATLEQFAEAATDKMIENWAAIAELMKAMTDITAIKYKMTGGDWDEIEEAQEIARAAIKKHSTTTKEGN